MKKEAIRRILIRWPFFIQIMLRLWVRAIKMFRQLIRTRQLDSIITTQHWLQSRYFINRNNHLKHLDYAHRLNKPLLNNAFYSSLLRHLCYIYFVVNRESIVFMLRSIAFVIWPFSSNYLFQHFSIRVFNIFNDAMLQMIESVRRVKNIW